MEWYALGNVITLYFGGFSDRIGKLYDWQISIDENGKEWLLLQKTIRLLLLIHYAYSLTFLISFSKWSIILLLMLTFLPMSLVDSHLFFLSSIHQSFHPLLFGSLIPPCLILNAAITSKCISSTFLSFLLFTVSRCLCHFYLFHISLFHIFLLLRLA